MAKLDWLKGIAPTVATALGGPLAGAAATVVAKWLGVEPDQVEKTLAAGKLSGDQIAALKKAEIEFDQRMAELDIDLERVHGADRASAREMQAATKSMLPGGLAILITVGFFGILFGMLGGKLDVANNDSLLLLLGALSTAWGGVINFYFGSSRGSSEKTAMLASRNPR